MSSLFDRLQAEIDSRERQEGLSQADLLALPPVLAKVITRIIRRNGMKLVDVAQALGQPSEDTQQTLDQLVQKGYVRQVKVNGEVWYKARFARKRGSTLALELWSALDSALESQED